MPKHAAAYLRRSSVSTDSPGDASREAQQEATRRLAAAFAPGAELREYVDWGISGRKADRPAYLTLKADIAAGRVCCVLTYSLSRLGRTARELDELFTLCERHDVQVVTQADGTLTATSATGKFLRRILGELAELESELAKERIGAALAAKRARGDDLGQPGAGYRVERGDGGRLVHVRDESQAGYMTAVLDAVRETGGNILGACRLLEQRRVPAPRGGRRWSTSALTRIVGREAPGLLARRLPAGRRAPVHGHRPALSGLVSCGNCGKTMTPNERRGQLYCSAGQGKAATHGKMSTLAAPVIDFLRAETERLGGIAFGTADDSAARREAAMARLERARELFMAGDLDRGAYAAEKARADRELADLADTDEVVATDPRIGPVVDWAAPPADVNDALRRLFREVRLDAEQRPVEAVWRNPALRPTAAA